MLQSTQYSCFTSLRGFPNLFQSDVEQLHVRNIYWFVKNCYNICISLFYLSIQ